MCVKQIQVRSYNLWALGLRRRHTPDPQITFCGTHCHPVAKREIVKTWKHKVNSALESLDLLRPGSSVQSLRHVRLFVTPWTEAHQASLSITNSQSLLKLMSIESVMPSNHLILCPPLLLLPLIFPSIRVFSNESVLHTQVAKLLDFQLQHQSFQWIFRVDFL